MKVCKKLLKELAEKYHFELGNDPVKSVHDNSNKINWHTVSCWKLSEGFIREFQYKVKWDCISAYQKLSENFIEEFQNKVDWFGISYNQMLSEDFIRKFKTDIRWFHLHFYQQLSEEFVIEFQDKIFR